MILPSIILYCQRDPCPVSKLDSDSPNHIFFYCGVAQELWDLTTAKLDYNFKSFEEMGQHSVRVKSSVKTLLDKCYVLCHPLWCLWLDRNDSISQPLGQVLLHSLGVKWYLPLMTILQPKTILRDYPTHMALLAFVLPQISPPIIASWTMMVLFTWMLVMQGFR